MIRRPGGGRPGVYPPAIADVPSEHVHILPGLRNSQVVPTSRQITPTNVEHNACEQDQRFPAPDLNTGHSIRRL
jgi:hypothetical protein